MLTGNILITGGTGTLGYALAARIVAEGYPCRVTIYSRDPMKQQTMRRKFPSFRYALGDVCDGERLRVLATGHDTIMHLAAQKHIPEAEANPRNCAITNVYGTQQVIEAARHAGANVLFVSTDKACWPVNFYGATKIIGERLMQEAAGERGPRINICRYGNVVGSTGSVIPAWRQAMERGERPKLTCAEMTRFWLTAEAAVDLILFAMGEPSGSITIPRLPALSMARLAEYVIGPHWRNTVDVIGLRPGEKMHEMLLTPQEAPYCAEVPGGRYLRLYPVTGSPAIPPRGLVNGYTSDMARELSSEELAVML